MNRTNKRAVAITACGAILITAYGAGHSVGSRMDLARAADARATDTTTSTVTFTTPGGIVTVTPPTTVTPATTVTTEPDTQSLMIGIRAGNAGDYGMDTEGAPAGVRVTAYDQDTSLLITPATGGTWGWHDECAVQGTWADCDPATDANPSTGTGTPDAAIRAALGWLKN